MPDEPIAALRPHIVSGNKEVSKILVTARRRIEKAIERSLTSDKITQLASQSQLYNAIQSIYEDVDKELDSWLLRHTGEVVSTFNAIALDDLGLKGVATFDKDYVQEVFERMHPNNKDSIAAVRTKRMLQSDIDELRALAIEKSRLAAVAGQTQKQHFRELKNAWEGLFAKGGLNSFQFIDRSGKKWENNNYFSMLVRTTSGRIHRDTYLDTLTANGKDLARINNSGATSCPACTNFNGVIVSISGNNKRFPSEAEARSGGVFHPNCLCYYSYVDQDRDEEEIDLQENLPNPVTDEPQEWLDYAKLYQEAKKVEISKAPARLKQANKKQQEKKQEEIQEKREEDAG